jgi:hypothetical protein
MLDKEIYLEQCVGIRRAGGHAPCVSGCVVELFSQSTSFAAPINGGLKKERKKERKKKAVPLLALNFDTYLGIL